MEFDIMNIERARTFAFPLQPVARVAFGWRARMVLCLTGIFSGAALASAAVALDRISQLVPDSSTNTQIQGMPTADFDGDGLLEAVALHIGRSSDIIRIFGFQAGTGWVVKQSVIPEGGEDYNGRPKVATW